MIEAQISVIVPAVWLCGKTTCVSSKIYAWKLPNLALSHMNCCMWTQYMMCLVHHYLHRAWHGTTESACKCRDK